MATGQNLRLSWDGGDRLGDLDRLRLALEALLGT